VNTENLATPTQSHILDLGQHPAQAGAVRDGDGAPAVHTRGLTKRYGPRTVVDTLDIDIPAGVVAGFVGPTAPAKRPPFGCCWATSSCSAASTPLICPG
jgi:hypothetical protein